ncbi:PilZ domain-containing protein [Rheinheimera texasensis]|uniref:PilZ domain-containing protein n=1 Tax=Rheinheimera texasensis TaxID=306205 RepID=UPI0004E268F4|nr:PilZ domain-containing protein [Rheinheimera texasensis]
MTTPDLLPYLGIIERLKPLLNSNEFSEVFTILTQEIPKPKQFLLKMELKRLGQPCNYYIDLRGRVDGEVRPFEHGGKTHYMDDTAVKAFERGLKRYGQYTLGLYEEVMNTDNNYRVRHKQETEQRLQAVIAGDPLVNKDPTPDTDQETDKAGPRIVQFASYCSRGEERMNFTIDIEVELDDGETFQASTVDLSVSGSKLKVPGSRRLQSGQKIALHFTGLEQEFALGLSQGIPYQVIDSELVDRSQYVRVKRLPLADERGFTDFLKQFIHGNKRRYKVNLDNTLDAVIVKGYEQFYLPRIASLPVFLAVRDGLPVPVCVLTTENNRQHVQYFQDERQQSVLMQILSGKRLKACLQKAPVERSTVLYCFTHAAKGKLYFYSATADELAQQPQLQSVFFGFGAQKPSWRVFHLVVHRTHPQDSHMLLSLPDTADQEIQKLNQPPPPIVQQFIQDFRYIAALTEINHNESNLLYQQISFDETLLGQLKIFGHPKVDELPPLEAVAVQYVNLRAEGRFLYKTRVLLKINNQQYIEAHTRDFSSRGLQIETHEQIAYQKGDKVQLALPDMQKISSKYGLQDLEYEVMAVSKNQLIMNLRIVEQEAPHQGRLFFEQLIKNNRAKLTMAEETPKFAGLGQALRNMYVKALNSFPFFMHRHGIRYDLNVLGQGAEPNNLHRLLGVLAEDKTKPNLQPLLKNSATNLHFANQLKGMKRQDPPRTYEVFIRYRQNQQKMEQSFVTEFDFDLKTTQAKHFFVQDALANDLLFAFRIHLSRTGRPDTEHINKELSYISVYAIHKAKVLEEELWSVVGVGDVIDISDEVLLRFSIPTEQIQSQQQKRRSFIQQLEQSS